MKGFKQITIVIVFFISLTSCEEIIEVADISNQTVMILAPLDNTQIDTLNVKFNWNLVKDANQYRIQIAEPGFVDAEQILVDELINAVDSLNTGNSFDYEFTNDGVYEWRVKALNANYETPFTTASFIINTQ